MAITIVQRPKKFTPTGNPVIWQIHTDNANTIYFRAEVTDALNNVINTLDIFPSPELQDGAFVDLSRLLANTVIDEIDNDITHFVKDLSKPVQGYKVKFTEKIINATTGVVSTGATFYDATDVNYVFNANLDRINFKAYDDNDYVIRAANSKTKFLTYKPDDANTNKAGSEYLYFMQDGSAGTLTVKVRVYNPNGTLNSTQSAAVPNTSTKKMYRLAVSQKALKSAFAVSMIEGQFYTVAIEDQNGLQKTELRKYKVKDIECNLEVVNIFWTNSVGGVDSYQFVNPQESLNVTRTTIKKLPFRIDAGVYSDQVGGNWNTTEEILNAVPSIKIAVYTRPLVDQEVFWLGEMVYSKQCFVELSDGSIVPVTLDGTTYNYQRQRYLQNQLNVMKFTFSFAEWVVPAISNGTVSYIMSTTYVNSERSQTFQKQGCPSPSQVGTFVTYTVPAGTFTSDISKADANAKADLDILLNGQAYANSHGVCVAAPQFGNEARSVTLARNDCGAGHSGTDVTYTVPANTFFDYTLAGANALRDADITANAQAYANAHGTCSTSVGNDPRSQTFTRNNCPTGQAGGPYIYQVAANTYFAATLAAANALADQDVAANGQNAANLNGTCSILAPSGIQLYVSSWTVDGSGYSDVYYSIFSYQPVTDNITISVVMHDQNGATYLVQGAFMWNGSTQSMDVWAGQYQNPFGDNNFTIDIVDVSPNPDGNGTTYTW